jgi:hypothetical protein
MCKAPQGINHILYLFFIHEYTSVIKMGDREYPSPCRVYAECREFSTKLIPFRSAIKPIMTGMIVGKRPMISSRTPPSISAVTTVLSVVVVAS